MRKFIWAAGALGLAAAFTATPVKACTTVVDGKKATTDGSTLVARNEDVGAWSKHFYVHQATSNGPTTYVSEDNGFKTSLPKTALRYTSMPDGEQVNGQWIFGENGVIFSDKNEIWYMEIGSGHTWAAVRVPDNQKNKKRFSILLEKSAPATPGQLSEFQTTSMPSSLTKW
ncbi:C69 family dipeptidase [Lactobacillus delbrueckii]|uniref:C69 family dipeptidase n=1 Tax=Lactobacillus delbrueckii TaxID=1584 RepID=UPI001E2DCADE|nr:C69 family dipeptidase [Lactobacillus delbrueckii]MCD5565568.1 C69 family dipeptidase [Lactobacillus delbrueckii subsp. lactis]